MKSVSAVLFLVLVGVAPLSPLAGGATTSTVTIEHPTELRDRVIQENIRILRDVRTDAESLTIEQEEAVRILGAYRSEEAAPMIVRIIKAKGQPRRGSDVDELKSRVVPRDEPSDERPAVAALANIGVAALLAICEDMMQRDNAGADGDRLRLYVSVIHRLFPGDVGIVYVRELRLSAPEKSAARYDPLLKVLEAQRKPRIKIVTLEEPAP